MGHSLKICFEAIEQLPIAFGKLGSVVPIRGRRGKFYEECWVLRRCIATLIKAECLSLPLEIERLGGMGQSDFQLTEAQARVRCVDITEATTNEDRKEFVLSDKVAKPIAFGEFGGRPECSDPELCAKDIFDAVERKSAKLYATRPLLLLIYVNSNPAVFAETNDIARAMQSFNINACFYDVRIHALHSRNPIVDAFTEQQFVFPVVEI